MSVIAVPASWMRGGTSKGLFISVDDLPAAAADPAWLDRLLLRLLGSPDPYRMQIDGLGCATPSTSKVVLVARSRRPGIDLDYRFGAVAIDRAAIDWSGNCGNLTTAVAPFALQRGMLPMPAGAEARVVLWQATLGQRIVATVPLHDGMVLEEGTFQLDGVAFDGAEVRLRFLDLDRAGEGTGAALPTGRPLDVFDLPGRGPVRATLVSPGAPTVVVAAEDLGLSGRETAAALAASPDVVDALREIRRQAAVRFELVDHAEDADERTPHAPRVAFAGPPTDYGASNGRPVRSGDHDVAVRMLSLGGMHHALTGTGAVSLGVAAAIPGTVIAMAMGGEPRDAVRIGHPAGVMQVGAQVDDADGCWQARSVSLGRSARRLMDGLVYAPLPD